MDFNITTTPLAGQSMVQKIDLNAVCNQYANQGGSILFSMEIALVTSLIIMMFWLINALPLVLSVDNVVSIKYKIITSIVGAASIITFLTILITTIKLYVMS